MTTPVRLQLSRRYGFNLQALSLRTNGLLAVSVARPTMFGNPWKARDAEEVGYRDGASMAVKAFRGWLAHHVDWRHPEPDVSRDLILGNLHELRGKNLACWCAPDAPCHADVLLEFANFTPAGVPMDGGAGANHPPARKSSGPFRR